MMTCLYQVGSAVTDSISDSIAGAIWNQMIPRELAHQGFNATEIKHIIESITYAQNLPDNGTYQSVKYAYGETQKVLSIIGICTSLTPLLFTLGMKTFFLDDRDAEHQQQLFQEQQDLSPPSEAVVKA